MATAAVAAAAKPMSIQVQSVPLRATPSFLGRAVATAAYADRVEVLADQNGWMQVRTPQGTTGWVHESALSRKELVLKAGADDVSRTASGEELALAGKGFNSQVEADFKSRNQDVDFTWIDRMGQMVIKDTEMLSFLKEGGLQP
jgi:SH3-like domain-containing protein